MATNTIVARGGVESVPPISLAFWRWFNVFIILFPFFFSEILKRKKDFNKEFLKLTRLRSILKRKDLKIRSKEYTINKKKNSESLNQFKNIILTTHNFLMI